jgi:type IV secretory pathway component VirB8
MDSLSEDSKRTRRPSGLLYMRLAESVRLWQIISVVLIGIITLQAIALTSLFPLKQTKFKYIEFVGSGDVYYRILPTTDLTADQKTILVRKALRKYVYDRNFKDDITEKIRVKNVRAMSDDSVWDDFKEQFSLMLKQMDKTTRDVEIISDSIIDKNIHQVEFRAVDRKNNLLAERNFIATIRYEIVPNPIVNSETGILNPLGIKVTGYNISERKMKEK